MKKGSQQTVFVSVLVDKNKTGCSLLCFCRSECDVICAAALSDKVQVKVIIYNILLVAQYCPTLSIYDHSYARRSTYGLLCI